MIINHEATLEIPMYEFTMDDAKLTIAKGNAKVGKTIYTISTLPGNDDHLLTVHGDTLLCNIGGTCSRHCEHCFNGGCYAVGSAQQHHNAVIPAWARNTLLLRSGRLFDEVDAYISEANKKYAATGKIEDAKVRIFRINVSGEIENVEQFEGWNAVAANHPEVTFGLYTKNYEDLDTFLRRYGKTEDNFVINVSEWHGTAAEFLKKYAGKVNVFEYDDSNRRNNTLSAADKERLAGLTHCPAVTAAGKHAKDASGGDITCDHCMRCYRKTGKVTAVYAH